MHVDGRLTGRAGYGAFCFSFSWTVSDGRAAFSCSLHALASSQNTGPSVCPTAFGRLESRASDRHHGGGGRPRRSSRRGCRARARPRQQAAAPAPAKPDANRRQAPDGLTRLGSPKRMTAFKGGGPSAFHQPASSPPPAAGGSPTPIVDSTEVGWSPGRHGIGGFVEDCSRNEPLTHHRLRQRLPRVDAEFPVDAAEVVLDRLRAEKQGGGRFPCCLPFTEEQCNL